MAKMISNKNATDVFKAYAKGPDQAARITRYKDKQDMESLRRKLRSPKKGPKKNVAKPSEDNIATEITKKKSQISRLMKRFGVGGK